MPDNRWDLLADRARDEPPTVSVVVPYFEAQHQLDLVLTGLAAQTHPAARLEVVVADDGSGTPPDLGAAGPLAVQLVRQPDRGFRAAAARNLGAAAASGDVLLFLDGDTVPEPDYVDRLARLPGLAPDVLTVGRRRHADFTGWGADRSVAGWPGHGPGPTELPEPEWLRDGYAASRDLLDADERSYRYVISAVMRPAPRPVRRARRVQRGVHRVRGRGLGARAPGLDRRGGVRPRAGGRGLARRTGLGAPGRRGTRPPRTPRRWP